MNKWYQPFSWLLLAAMVGNMGGCAQTNSWLSKKTAKKDSEEKLASSDKKDASKSKKSKSTKDVADAKSAGSKTSKSAKDGSKTAPKDTKVAQGSKTKKMDAEHEKYAAAERANKKKSTVDTAVAKNDKSEKPEKKETQLVSDTKAEKVADTKAEKPAKSTVKPKTDDDLDAFIAQTETPLETAKRPAVKKAAAVDSDLADDSEVPAKKAVVQVKKEVAKDEDEDFADWADSKPTQHKKAEKPAEKPAEKSVEKTTDVAESFDEDFQTPAVAKSKPKPKIQGKAVSWSDDSFDESADDLPQVRESVPSKKTQAKKAATGGMVDTCPNADGELADLLQTMNADDPESLKQGLHRIGQMRRGGTAAAPLLRKMLKHEDAFVRVHSALAMARLNMTSAESIAVVTDSLKSRNASLRSFGSSVLGEMGPNQADVLASLAESLKDRNGQTRLCAAEVLIRHEEWSYPALQCLLACLKDKDENVRWLTTYSLAELAPESPEAVQALLKAAHDPVMKVRVGAVYALGEIGPYAKRAGDELRRMLESADNDELKSSINHTLRQINKDAN